jgi:hypothetical protein
MGREAGGREGDVRSRFLFMRCHVRDTIISMAVFDTFSKREQRKAGYTSDVYEYAHLPGPLRVQLVNILKGMIGPPENGLAWQHYNTVHDAICHEIGTLVLAEGATPGKILFNFVLQSENVEQILDVIEMAIREMETKRSASYRQFADATATPKEAADEINFRFRENAIGYQYESGRILRIDSQVAHSEIVKPALQLLADPRYEGPQQEFLNAHQHYRDGKNKECIADCLKAFESAMKTICDKRGWAYNKTDTANALIQVCVQNNLIDPMLLSHVGALRTVLEAGVPTVRNRLAGHGQGAAPVAVPGHYASYALHLTAANILFLVNSEKALS